MLSRRIIGVAALGAAAASMTFIPTAGAQENEVTFGASASGQALALSVFGEELTVGRTAAGLDSTVLATASGIGLATPVFEAGVSNAKVNAEGTDGSAEETCEGELPVAIPGLTLSAACSSSLAEITGGLPHSVATGGIASVTVNPIDTLLQSPLSEIVGAPVETALEEAEAAVDQLVDGLRPITQGVDDALDLGVEDTVDTLFSSLFDRADLLSISLGQTVTDTVAGAGALSATCASEAGRIDVLDAPATVAGIDPEPVLSVIISSATTKVDVSTTDGSATPTVDQAIVTVVVPTMGINQPVGPGETIEIPLPEPLGTSTIAVADSRTGVDENGQTFAIADSVFLDLLNGEAMNGGVELSLANCTSVAGASIEAPLPVEKPVPALPRTGSAGPNALALAATIAFAGLGLSLVRRSGSTTS